jgi:acetyl esterase/lipase
MLVWIHGGALIGGHRASIRSEQLRMYLEGGYALVSIDYRLAPETKLEGILEDIVDAFAWVREEGPSLAGVDPGRIGAIGHSAGGYLALVSGYRVKPRPRALVSFYGYGDIAGDWYARPDPFYCLQEEVGEREARAAVGSIPIAEPPEGKDRGRYYLFLRQRGFWPQEVVGLDPVKEPGAFRDLCPIQNISRDYPPTLLLHGNRDTDVPYRQSVMMAQELDRHGVENEFITIPGGGHGFDGMGSSDPKVSGAFHRVMAFLEGQV